MTVIMTNSKEKPERYKCAGFKNCGYSSSHCEGYGGFIRIGHRMLCPDCADKVRAFERQLFGLSIKP